jgi:predicted aconitase/predicted aconitase with swiveling domain
VTSKLLLTEDQRAMLAGQASPGVQKAMEIVVALGQIYGATDLVPVASAQVSGVSYKNLGDAGLEFLQAWAAQGAGARVPATLNPAGMDLNAWRQLGFSEHFAHRQQRVIAAYTALGVQPTCTCTPYLVGHVPTFGQHVAWAESSAVSYANSVLGARTNREGGPSALAAAITGYTARYGLHLDAQRRATVVIDVRCPLRSESDVGALGYLIGQRVEKGVPYLRLVNGVAGTLFDEGVHPSGLNKASSLKTLGAAMAASGAVALYHLQDVTPEAHTSEVLASGTPLLVIDDLAPGYSALDGPAEHVDLVSLGCPHASLAEIEAIADYMNGRQAETALWITTARLTRDAAQAAGLVNRIEAAGGQVLADTCMVVAPVADLGFRVMATNSAKMAFYAPAHSGISVRFGPLAQCLEAAMTGKWPGSARALGPHRQGAGTSEPSQASGIKGASGRGGISPPTQATRRTKGSQAVRVIKAGTAEGLALVSPLPIGFLGGVDPETGLIIEPRHPLQGQTIAGRILIFPTGKGSTVGSYTLYRMAQGGTAPAAIVNLESEAIVAVGAIISDIPMVDQADIAQIRTGDWVRIEGDQLTVTHPGGVSAR